MCVKETVYGNVMSYLKKRGDFSVVIMLVFSFRIANGLLQFCVIFTGSFDLSRIYIGKVTNLQF